MYYRSPRDKPGNISARFNSERKKFETNKIKSFGRWKKVLLEKFCVCVCNISCAWRNVTSSRMFESCFREHGVAVNSPSPSSMEPFSFSL